MVGYLIAGSLMHCRKNTTDLGVGVVRIDEKNVWPVAIAGIDILARRISETEKQQLNGKSNRQLLPMDMSSLS